MWSKLLKLPENAFIWINEITKRSVQLHVDMKNIDWLVTVDYLIAKWIWYEIRQIETFLKL